MATWFSVRVVYDAKDDKGKDTKKKELYLIDALNFTEAEARAVGEVKPFVEGELKVTAMKMEEVSEIFNQADEKADKWYRVRVHFITPDEKSGKEKRKGFTYIVKGLSVENATDRLHEGMKGTLTDYEIHTVSETQYMDVFFYSLDKESDETR